MIKIYHNKQCSKSCAALEFLQEHTTALQVQEYLEEVPNKEQLTEILSQLGLKPLTLIRKNEPLFLEKFQHLTLTDEEWVDVMVQNPILIERPIIIKDGKAVIGRPLERVIDLFK